MVVVPTTTQSYYEDYALYSYDYRSLLMILVVVVLLLVVRYFEVRRSTKHYSATVLVLGRSSTPAASSTRRYIPGIVNNIYCTITSIIVIGLQYIVDNP